MDRSEQASRFMMQATLGADRKLISKASQMGIRAWLDKELSAIPAREDGFEPLTRQIWAHFRARLKQQHGEAAINGEGNNPALPYKWYFHMAWWHKTLTTQEHLVRHRVAQALSEILVISENSPLELDAVGMASFYDLLYHHAFGSYADLLTKVSLHPCMGVYLSHMNNQKADPARNIHPDENYAREIMQLFTIGLHRLRPDGSIIRDNRGRPIPTYDNRDIKALARVFTGLTAHSYSYEWATGFWPAEYNGYPVTFNDGIGKIYKTLPYVEMTRPMSVDEKFHDRGKKQLLGNHIRLPGGQDGKKEIRAAVKALVAHPNTAPFIAQRLINQMVTSNPSPEYVRAVAEAFGPGGDLKKTVRKILTWPIKKPAAVNQIKGEIRSQKLKSPLLRVTQLLRAFRASNSSGRLWLIGDDIKEQIFQHPLSAPTVFNFYSPDFTPHGPLETAGLAAPEFELHTSAGAISYVNMLYYFFFADYLPAVSTEISNAPDEKNAPLLDPDILRQHHKDRLKLGLSKEIAQAKNPDNHDALIDEISLLLTGKKNLTLKPKIKSAFESYKNHPDWVVQTIVFMVAVSADFTVQEA